MQNLSLNNEISEIQINTELSKLSGLSLNSDFKYIPEFDPKKLGALYLRHIYKRIHRDKFNFLGMFTGKHRTAKSTTAVAMAHTLDRTFEKNLEDRVVYFPKDFMRALKIIKKKDIKGAAIVWDEAGVGIPAREWYDISNKSIAMTLQVFGVYLPIVFFVTPDVSYIDSQARKLFHGFYEMSRKKKEYAIIKPFDVRYNKRNTKVYYVYSRFHLKNEGAYGPSLILKRINIFPPNADLQSKYEVHSKEFKDVITEQMAERTKAFEQGSIDAKQMTYDDLIKTLVENKNNPLYLSSKSKEDHVIFNTNSIAYEFDIPNRLAAHIKRKAEIEINKIPEKDQIKEE
jgi:hypothetical protein